MATDREQLQEITRIVVRPLGSALPLGFFAFGTGTVLLAAVELKWIGPAEKLALISVVLAFVAPLELLASVFAFFSRDTGAGTAMAIFGAGWIALSLYFLNAGMQAKTATFGIFLIMDSLAILALGMASYSGKPLLSVILLIAAARFLLVACVQFGAGAPVALASGAVGLLTGVFAVYGGLALLLEDVKQKTVLPMFRRRNAKAALEGSLEDQLDRIASEAGVRQQL
jgi:succinate-acetate transporter protein